MINSMDEIANKEVITVNEAVVYRIRKLMETNDITSVHELARICEVRQSTLNEILKGRSNNPRIHTIYKLAYGCDISMQEFFGHSIFSKVEGNPHLRLKK